MQSLKSPMKIKKTPMSADGNRAAAIYQKAAQLIHEKGYDATSMNDIAAAVQMTKAGLYYYISGKQELLFRIMNYGMDRLEEEVIEPARAASDHEERLRTVIARHVRLVAGGIGAVSILMDEEAGLPTKERRQIRKRKRAYFEFLREILAALKSEGKLGDLDPTAATFGLFGMILWLPRWYNPAGPLTAERLAQQMTTLALKGLLCSRSAVEDNHLTGDE
jgi:AcrR family transcriptional regulator